MISPYTVDDSDVLNVYTLYGTNIVKFVYVRICARRIHPLTYTPTHNLHPRMKSAAITNFLSYIRAVKTGNGKIFSDQDAKNRVFRQKKKISSKR